MPAKANPNFNDSNQILVQFNRVEDLIVKWWKYNKFLLTTLGFCFWGLPTWDPPRTIIADDVQKATNPESCYALSVWKLGCWENLLISSTPLCEKLFCWLIDHLLITIYFLVTTLCGHTNCELSCSWAVTNMDLLSGLCVLCVMQAGLKSRLWYQYQ